LANFALNYKKPTFAFYMVCGFCRYAIIELCNKCEVRNGTQIETVQMREYIYSISIIRPPDHLTYN